MGDQSAAKPPAWSGPRAQSEVRLGAPEGAPHISGELIRQALLGEAVPSDCPLKLERSGARIEGVVIEGGLSLATLEYRHPISFERCTFDGPISLRSAKLDAISFVACTAPMLYAPRAEIAGGFDLNGTRLDNPAGAALDANGIRVYGNLSLANLRTSGAVNLSNAFVGDSLDLSGGHFRFPVRTAIDRLQRSVLREMALCCTGIEVRQNVVISDDFIAEGFVGFQNAQAAAIVLFNCSIVAGEGVASGLILTGVRARGLNFGSIKRFEGLLAMSPTTTIRFGDDSTLWLDKTTGKPRKDVVIQLGAFHYEGLLHQVGNVVISNDAVTRLAWLKMQPADELTTHFNPAPFTRLAEVLRNMGDSRGARTILFERERLRLGAEHVGFWEKIGGHILGVFAGYGYKNHFALYWALGIWLIGAAIFGLCDRLGQMRPADPHVLAEHEYQETLRPPTDYEPVNPLIYSADILLPIVELGQQQYWIPRGAHEHKPRAEDVWPRIPHALARTLDWLVAGWLPKAYYYFEIFMGWLLVSIVIAGFSGLLGHAREE